MAFTTKDSSVESEQPSIKNNVFQAEVYNARRQREGTSNSPPPAYPSNVQTLGGGGSTSRQSNRMCPNARGCWDGLSFSAFSPFTNGDKALLMRRICMIGILSVRTLISVLSVIWHAYGRDIAGFIISIILAVLGFFFVAWCLMVIGNMSGYRRVLGKLLGRWHYDVFLAANLVVHVGILVGVILRMPGTASGTIWILLWLLLFAAAWIATWQPEGEASMV